MRTSTSPIDVLKADLQCDPFFKQHVGLVVWGTYRVGNFDLERKVDAIKTALCMAHKGWDPARAKFTTYFAGACRWARVEASRQYRIEVERHQSQSLNAIENFDVAAPRGCAAVEDKDDAAAALAALDARTRDIVQRVYMQGQTYEAVGKVHGISRERVRQILLAALPKMRTALGVRR